MLFWALKYKWYSNYFLIAKNFLFIRILTPTPITCWVYRRTFPSGWLIVESTTTHALPISQRREECRSWLVDYTPWGLPLYSSQILTPGHGYLERYRWFLQLIHTKQLTSKSNSIIKSCMLNMSYIDGKHVLFLVLHLVYF